MSVVHLAAEILISGSMTLGRYQRSGGMMRTRSMRRAEDGFTLIELLLVILIIGLLAAIAMPILLSQREKAQRAAAVSDLRNIATAMDAYLVDSGNYGSAAQVAGAETVKVSSGTTIVVVQRLSSVGYCLAALRNVPVPGSIGELESQAMGWYDSQAGGLQPSSVSNCPATSGAALAWQTDTFVGAG
jgi:prepilin-type N-terminal cleavage/methylation domain-containing protein